MESTAPLPERVAIVTDAWEPQVNGVVRTLKTTGTFLERAGCQVEFITPREFRTVPLPTYPEIRIALRPYREVARRLETAAPEAIHIATEGPLGHAAHRYCRRRGVPFTTAFHTQFPEYIRMRVPFPVAWSYAYLRRFHAAAVRTMVPTASQREQLVARGFEHLVLWARGVDLEIFKPDDPVDLGVPGPIAVYMGRVAVEKNIEAFLDLAFEGSKVVIGNGPDRERLAQHYPAVKFLGPRYGRELARHVAAADVFVFPSRTDTFGLVLLEAMACGVPVAAYPVQGPIDVVTDPRAGALDEDLSTAVQRALALDRHDCIKFASQHSWDRCTAVFRGHLAPIAG